jgi:hypothetical protein
MGYLSPQLNEDLVRGYGAEQRARADLHRQVKAARMARPDRLKRWKTRLGWALVGAGLGLLSQPPDGPRRRPSVLSHAGQGGGLRPVPTPVPCHRASDA